MKSNGWFPTMFDDFFNTDFMPRANSTAPAVNVKESEKAYTMELAAPGIKKEYCRVAINDEATSPSPSRTSRNTSMRTVTVTICAVSSAIRTTSRTTHCPMMWYATRSLPRWRTASSPSRCRRPSRRRRSPRPLRCHST